MLINVMLITKNMYLFILWLNRLSFVVVKQSFYAVVHIDESIGITNSKWFYFENIIRIS